MIRDELRLHIRLLYSVFNSSDSDDDDSNNKIRIRIILEMYNPYRKTHMRSLQILNY
jgi:hypothetical protein